jgi:hypothetical protein
VVYGERFRSRPYLPPTTYDLPIVDYQKVDAALAAAMQEAPDPDERSLVVFIHAERALSVEERSVVERLGVSGGQAGPGVVTATLSARAVEELTEQSWVRYVRLSRRMRPLESG